MTPTSPVIAYFAPEISEAHRQDFVKNGGKIGTPAEAHVAFQYRLGTTEIAVRVLKSQTIKDARTGKDRKSWKYLRDAFPGLDRFDSSGFEEEPLSGEAALESTSFRLIESESFHLHQSLPWMRMSSESASITPALSGSVPNGMALDSNTDLTNSVFGEGPAACTRIEPSFDDDKNDDDDDGDNDLLNELYSSPPSQQLDEPELSWRKIIEDNTAKVAQQIEKERVGSAFNPVSVDDDKNEHAENAHPAKDQPDTDDEGASTPGSQDERWHEAKEVATDDLSMTDDGSNGDTKSIGNSNNESTLELASPAPGVTVPTLRARRLPSTIAVHTRPRVAPPVTKNESLENDIFASASEGATDSSDEDSPSRSSSHGNGGRFKKCPSTQAENTQETSVDMQVHTFADTLETKVMHWSSGTYMRRLYGLADLNDVGNLAEKSQVVNVKDDRFTVYLKQSTAMNLKE